MGTLTRRQREFLATFLRLYRRLRRPLHYGAVARAMRIGRATAYEMLAALEGLGLVARHYQSPEGPGRPRVLFRPTAQARRILAGVWEAPVWRAAQARVRAELQALQARLEPTAALQWLTARVEEGSIPEGMARMAAGIGLVLRFLQAAGSPWPLPQGKALDLGALASLSAALTALARAEPPQVHALLSRIRWFQAQWERLDPTDRRRLSRFTRQILQETWRAG